MHYLTDPRGLVTQKYTQKSIMEKIRWNPRATNETKTKQLPQVSEACGNDVKKLHILIIFRYLRIFLGDQLKFKRTC